MFISIIIPAYNEEKRLEKTVLTTVDFLNKNNYQYEIIIVNDGSADNTLSVAKRLSKDLKNIRVLSYSQNKGKGFSVRSGMLDAKGELIFFIDADGSTPINELSKLLPYFSKGFDVVIGSRKLIGSRIEVKQPASRRALGYAANRLIRFLILPGIYDSQCGFKGFTEKSAKLLFNKQTIFGWGFDFEILALARRLGFTIKEVPVQWLDSGSSRLRPIRGSLATLSELLKVRLKLTFNKYK